ncbi:acyl-CoA dehydrogenase family protein [Streptomyces sp. L7]
MSRRRIYHSFNPQGLNIIAASLLTFGTEQQKRDWAVPLLRAEITASLGMSEPGRVRTWRGYGPARSSTETTSSSTDRRCGPPARIDADVLLTFVRTDPKAPKHKGISVLLIPTDSEGLVRRPFGSIAAPDDLDFNEVFLHRASASPKENLVWPLQRGLGGWPTLARAAKRTLLWVALRPSRMDRSLIRDSRPPASEEQATTLAPVDCPGHCRGLLSGYRLRSAADRNPVEISDAPAAPAPEPPCRAPNCTPQDLPRDNEGRCRIRYEDRARASTANLSRAFTASWFERYARSFKQDDRPAAPRDPAQHQHRRAPSSACPG